MTELQIAKVNMDLKKVKEENKRLLQKVKSLEIEIEIIKKVLIGR